MSQETRGFYRFGGISLMISGVLFFVTYVLGLIAGPPPSTGAEILAWMVSTRVPLAWTSEVLFFATVFLIPAVAAVYLSLADSERTKAVFGCGIVAAVIPILAVVLILHGRLVYPVYGLRVSTPEIAELIIALVYGGLHATGLLFGAATIVLGLAMRRSAYGKAIAYAGIATGVLDIVGTYPWITGPLVALICQTAFTAWFLAVGAKLIGMRPSPA